MATTQTKETPKPKGKAGRPRKEIDYKIFENLCFLQCTKSEICSALGVDNNTLDRRLKEHYKDDFSNIYKKYSENGKISLRRILHEHAKKNPATAIFLSKNLLGYRDQPEATAEKVDGIILIDPDEPKAQKEKVLKVREIY